MKLAELKDQGVKHLFLNYVNIHGVCLGKTLPLESIERDDELKAYFAGTPDDGLGQEPNEEEVCGIPDVDAVSILPWNPALAWAPCSLTRYGRPHLECSRALLKANLASFYRGCDLKLNVGLEVEFYVFERREGSLHPASADEGDIPAYSLWGTLALSAYWDKLHVWASQTGIGIQSITHEGGRSQIEFSLSHTDPIRAADQFILFKVIARKLASDMGLVVSFMPRPVSDDLGSGLHTNISYHRLDARGKSTPCPDELIRATRGILQQTNGLAAIACPNVNSYRRLWAKYPPTSWISDRISIGLNDRTKLLRMVPRDGRLEFRLADPSANIYLLIAVLVAAGAADLENTSSPSVTLQELAARDYGTLPRTLIEALDSLASSDFVTGAIGERLKREFLRIKVAEWHSYVNHVSKWEVNKYLSS